MTYDMNKFQLQLIKKIFGNPNHNLKSDSCLSKKLVLFVSMKAL